MARTYKGYDLDTGRIVAVVGDVSDTVRLDSFATTNGSAAISFTAFASVAAVTLFPGMLIKAKGIPSGTTVLSVDSVSTATLSANATATASGLIAFAYGHNPAVATVEHAMGTYRDLFSYEQTVQISSGGANAGKLTSRGSVVYPTSPTFAAFGGGTTGEASVTATAAVSQSDDISHTAPREYKEKWSLVSFILSDGQEVLLGTRPNIHFAPV